MQKAKLGISVGLLGAAIYFLTFFGGYLPLVLLGGYVLLFEPNEWLRRAAVKAGVLMVLFSLASAAVNLLPTSVSFLDSFAQLFDSDISSSVVYNLSNILNTSLDIFKLVLFLILGFKALKQDTVRFGFIEKFITKFASRDNIYFGSSGAGSN